MGGLCSRKTFYRIRRSLANSHQMYALFDPFYLIISSREMDGTGKVFTLQPWSRQSKGRRSPWDRPQNFASTSGGVGGRGEAPDLCERSRWGGPRSFWVPVGGLPDFTRREGDGRGSLRHGRDRASPFGANHAQNKLTIFLC